MNDKGMVEFTDGVKTYFDGKSACGFYRTCVGPSFAQNGVVWGVTNNNQASALGRLVSLRYNDRKSMIKVDEILATVLNRPANSGLLNGLWNQVEASANRTETYARLLKDYALELEERMFELQDQNMYDRVKVETFCSWIQPSEHLVLADYIDSIQYAMDHVTDPHPKMVIRKLAWKELCYCIGRDGTSVIDKLWLKEVLYKMKPDEIAKVGKWARMIGDLGVAASLQGFGVTSLLKEMLCCPADGSNYNTYRGFRVYIAKKPDYALMKEIFEELINPTDLGTFAIFSDDSCASMRFADGVQFGNLDISGCDASHGTRAFTGLLDITPTSLKKDLDILIDQCKLPMVIQSLGTEKQTKMKKQTVRMKSRTGRPSLYSGSTLTTVINGGANGNIALQAIDEYHTGVLTRFEDIQSSAMRVGYYVTCERAEKPEKLQFLKYSPLKDVQGVYVPVLNLGVLFRASGVWKGDIPGGKNVPLRERNAAAQKQLLKGMYPRLSTPLVDAMKRQVEHAGTDTKIVNFVRKHLPYQENIENEKTIYIPSASFAERYSIDELWIAELEAYIRATGPDTQYATPFVDAVLKEDYGLRCELFTGEKVTID